MNLNRRRFCSALGVGSVSVSPIVGTASAQSEIPVSATITSAVGANLGGVELYFSKVDSDVSQAVTVPSDGILEFSLPQAGSYRVTLRNIATRNEDIPLVYGFPNITVDDSGGSGEITIPAAYDTQIRCVDLNGDPVSRLPVNFRASNGTGVRPGLFTTSEQGYVKYVGATETGVELTGKTEIEIQPPSDLSQTSRLATVTVDESREFEFVVQNPEQYTYNFQIVNADPAAGFSLPYLLYRPDVSTDVERPLYVVPNNNSPVTNREELIGQLTSTLDSSTFAGARRNGYPGIIPGFPRTPNDGPDYIQTLALPSYRSELLDERYRLDNLATDAFDADSLKRVDKQLLAMIADAKARLESEPYPVADKIHMSGFSASTTFSNRFAFLYPDKVRTLTTGGSSVLPIPKAGVNGTSLPYPLGTADYTELTGKEFDIDSWGNIDRYIYVGREDQPLPSTDSTSYFYGSGRYQNTVESVFGVNRVTERFQFVKSQYADISDHATFEIFDGVGHEISQQMEDSLTSFHQTHAPANDVQISNVQLQPTTIGSSQLHTLSFEVANLSADGQPDTFTIEMPTGVDIESINTVTADGIANPEIPDPVNPIRFTVNPSQTQTGETVSLTVELTLSD